MQQTGFTEHIQNKYNYFVPGIKPGFSFPCDTISFPSKNIKHL
jgi:hypothetical protein